MHDSMALQMAYIHVCTRISCDLALFLPCNKTDLHLQLRSCLIQPPSLCRGDDLEHYRPTDQLETTTSITA